MAYEPTEWKSGDVITATKLNKIETELDELDEKLEDVEALLADI